MPITFQPVQASKRPKTSEKKAGPAWKSAATCGVSITRKASKKLQNLTVTTVLSRSIQIYPNETA